MRCREIKLPTGHVVIVDQKDFRRLSAFSWTVARAKHTNYARSSQTGQPMHRYLLDAPRGSVVDHVNGNGLDNRRSNLRICTRAENLQNRRKHKVGTSRFKGVYLRYKGKKHCLWMARIFVQGKLNSLGLYRNEEDAAKAYDIAAIAIHGEFALTNFNPDGSENNA